MPWNYRQTLAKLLAAGSTAGKSALTQLPQLLT